MLRSLKNKHVLYPEVTITLFFFLFNNFDFQCAKSSGVARVVSLELTAVARFAFVVAAGAVFVVALVCVAVLGLVFVVCRLFSIAMAVVGAGEISA